MAGKQSFTQAEWDSLLQSVMAVGIAVSAADPNGLFGLLKESMAGARALLDAKTASTDELIQAVVGDFETSEGRTAARAALNTRFATSKPEEIKTQTMELLREVSSLLDTKAQADAVAFKTWLRHIAQSVAEAAKEGGFLGFGGVTVSDAEKATLAEITSALNLPASS